MTRRALFLDRDGVINVDYGYVHKQNDFEFVCGIFELVAHAVAHDYLVVVITNQAGIGRGYYQEADFHLLMGWVKQQFIQRGGGLDRVYFCPDHPEHGRGVYLRDTPMRKPGPGMLLQACHELDIDPAQSVLVGDQVTDIQAGQKAGVGINLLFQPSGDKSGHEHDGSPGFWRITTLQEAMAFVN